MRYASTRVGSHGGASPQEVLIPVAVLSAGLFPSGWDEAPPAEPAWWRGATEPSASATTIVSREAFAGVLDRQHADARQRELFTKASASGEAPTPPTWIDALLASGSFAAQRRLAGRGAPAEQQVRGLLCALVARSGRMSQTSLAQALSVPAFRVSGIVSAARRILNLDQAQVLVTDGDDVVLNERLLRVQFQLTGMA